MSHPPKSQPAQARLVVQVGFAGARNLIPPDAPANLDKEKFHEDVLAELIKVLGSLGSELGISEPHVFCGISQMAIGADTLFTRACAARDIKQRVFLPEHRQAFLDAREPGGPSDFTEDEARIARDLLDSPRIIEERVVSISHDRPQRFEDVNLEIVRVSDVLIALRPPQTSTKAGGTQHFIDRARARGKYLLEIVVSLGPDGRAQCDPHWRPIDPKEKQVDIPPFVPPRLPAVIDGFTPKLGDDYAAKLRDFAGGIADAEQKKFTQAAQHIIGAHVSATFLAVLALAFHYPWKLWMPYILGLEVVILFYGLKVHNELHHKGAVEHWATARLICELCRSVASITCVRGYLHHLFVLPLPDSFRSLLRTLNYHHLAFTCDLPKHDWTQRRAAYIRDRLHSQSDGQIPYYTGKREHARVGRNRARLIFRIATISAIIVGTVKLMFVWANPPNAWIKETLAIFAIMLPVVAVAALSLAASLDCDARYHTFSEMVVLLEQRRDHLCTAQSDAEFAALAINIEARLVGENASWYSRRVFTSVT